MIGEEKQQELSGKIQSLHLRRLKTEVLKDMPEKIEDVVWCDLSDEQRKVGLKFCWQRIKWQFPDLFVCRLTSILEICQNF